MLGRLGEKVRIVRRLRNRLAHDLHAICRHLGRKCVWPAEFGRRKHKAHELALFVGLCVVEDRRHVGKFGNRRLLGAQQERDLAVADELIGNAELRI